MAGRVQDVSDEAEFDRLIKQKGKLVVCDFSASWCGPCKAVAPAYHALAGQHPDVVFLKVMEDEARELIMEQGIKAFPTFRFYIDGQQVDEVQGADIESVKSKVMLHKKSVQPAFGGAGNSLGGSGLAPTEADARAARLARFGGTMTTTAPSREAGSAHTNAQLNAKLLAADRGDDDDDPRFKIKSASKADTPGSAAASGDAMAVDSTADSSSSATPATSSTSTAPAKEALRSVESSVLAQLTGDMGFPELRATKALIYSPQPGLEAAINWLMEHQEDADIDTPIPEGGLEPPVSADGAGANSLKCDDCGAALRDTVAAELHAHKTGHSNFSESTESIAPLTAEEKAAKLAALKEKIAARRVQREETEKVESIDKEKVRRTMGKEMRATKEEMDAQARKRDIAMQRREKDEQARERERLRAEIAKDKAERKARGGKLASTLGVDGYQPTGLQQDTTPAASSAAPMDIVAESAVPPSVASAEQVTKAVTLLSKQRVGGLGGVAMKTVLTIISNIISKPTEEKYRSIRIENPGFKSKVIGCVGGVGLLRAVGFVKVDDDGAKLVLSPEAIDQKLLNRAQDELTKAIASYVGY